MLSNSGFRSKSASEKKENSSNKDLKVDFKAYLRLNLDQPVDPSQKNLTKKQDKSQGQPVSIQRIDDQRHQNIHGLSKNPTAIDQLNILCTPRVENGLKMFQKGTARPMFKDFVGVQCAGIIDESFQKLQYTQETNRSASINSIQYYRGELIKVTKLLVNQQKKNTNLMLKICNLERQLEETGYNKKQLQQEVEHLKQSHRSLELKHSELQDLSKQQMIINLELQSLIGKLTIKHGRKIKEQVSMIEHLKTSFSEKKERYSSRFIAMQKELNETKHSNEENVQRLINQLQKKSAEIKSLKMKMNQMNEDNENNEKVGNSTIPSFKYLDSSRHEVEVKYNLKGKAKDEVACFEMEHISPLSLDTLSSNLFQSVKLQGRSLSKTDRI